MNSEVSFSYVDQVAFNAMAIQLLTDVHFRQQVRDARTVSITQIRASVDLAISASHMTPALLANDSFAVHQQLVKGLPGESLFIAIAMAFDTVQEGLIFFGLSANSSRRRIGRVLDPGESEKVLRLGSIALLVAHMLSNSYKARAYLRMPNFALGGMTPCDLLTTAAGERIVLNELQCQTECGPI